MLYDYFTVATVAIKENGSEFPVEKKVLMTTKTKQQVLSGDDELVQYFDVLEGKNKFAFARFIANYGDTDKMFSELNAGDTISFTARNLGSDRYYEAKDYFRNTFQSDYFDKDEQDFKIMFN